MQDKMQYEREEMKDRYANLDGLVRAELARKDDQIGAMQAMLET